MSSANIQFNRCCGRYRYGAVCCPCCLFSWNRNWEFLSESETFILPVSCALTADVDGGPELKGELQGGHSSLRFWPEESVQFHYHEMKSDLGVAGQRSRSSLRRWPENTEQFHEPENKGEMIGSRRRVLGKKARSIFAASLAGEN